MNRKKSRYRKTQTNVPSPVVAATGATRPMTIRVAWDGHEQIIADTPLRCKIPMAGTRKAMASGTFPSPMDLFVASLGGCPSHEILTILQERKKTPVHLAVTVEGTRRDTLPTIFTKIHVTFTLAGDIDDTIAREVIDDVMTLRCPVAVSFAKATELTWEYRIIPVVSLHPAHSPAASPTGDRDFNREAATWDEDPGKVNVARELARAIIGTIKPGNGMDVLDFGAGTGLVTLALQPRVRTITAVDSAQGMLDILDAKVRAQGMANVRTLRGDPDLSGLPRGAFDVAISSLTLHHIRDIRMLLDQLARVLKPSGRIAIADLDPENGKFHDTNDGVFHHGFDRQEMRKCFEAAGFCDMEDRTAIIIQKPGPAGTVQGFPVFLMTGTKQG